MTFTESPSNESLESRSAGPRPILRETLIPDSSRGQGVWGTAPKGKIRSGRIFANMRELCSLVVSRATARDQRRFSAGTWGLGMPFPNLASPGQIKCKSVAGPGRSAGAFREMSELPKAELASFGDFAGNTADLVHARTRALLRARARLGARSTGPRPKVTSSMQWSPEAKRAGEDFRKAKIGWAKMQRLARSSRASLSSKSCTLLLPLLLVSCVHQPMCKQHCNGASSDAPVYGTIPTTKGN